jgi:hypothetical protein
MAKRVRSGTFVPGAFPGSPKRNSGNREVAAEGVQRMIDRLAGEIAHGSASN